MPLEFKNMTPGSHICLIYRGPREQKEVISQFLAAGLRKGGKVFYSAENMKRDEILTWLRGLGIEDLEWGTDSLDVQPNSVVYYPEGHFSPPSMYRNIESFAVKTRESGFTAGRVTGEMSWALRGIPGSERLIEYEEGLNRILPKCGVTAMCQYDATQFGATFLMRVMKVHPMVVINKTLVNNPYFIPGYRG